MIKGLILLDLAGQTIIAVDNSDAGSDPRKTNENEICFSSIVDFVYSSTVLLLIVDTIVLVFKLIVNLTIIV